jgi:hypothetical protein
MPEEENPQKQNLILPHQKAAFERLAAIARVTFFVNRDMLPIKLRTNVMITGPSGSGKTYLARRLAEDLEVPFLAIGASEWIPLGASSKRGSSSSWPIILDFLDKSSKMPGAVIFIDELDKLTSRDMTSWSTYLRSEIYGCLDKIIPTNLNDSDGDCISRQKIAVAQKFFTNNTLIIAAGAFQHLWDDRNQPAMGFLPPNRQAPNPDLNDLAKTIPREMANRFGSNLIVLPPLVENDYRQMLELTACSIPSVWRTRFLHLGLKRIPEACRLQQGPRFLEEIMLETIIEERSELVNFRPKAVIEHMQDDRPDLKQLAF